MTQPQTHYLWGAASLLALALACSPHPAAPTSPASSPVASGDADEGVTLKASAPVPQSPINDVKIAEGTLTLTASAAAATFTSAPLQYRFQVLNDAGVLVQDSGLVASPSFTVTAVLDFEKRQTWRVRAEYQGAVGPWSAAASFITPAGAYVRGNEIRDPLINGTTVGRAFGCTFIPGQGVRLDSRESYVEWQLQTPLVEGEFSAEMTNLRNGTEEYKTKVMSMLQGDGVNITDNSYRVTLDKRTLWASQGSRIRYTIAVRGKAAEPAGGAQSWNPSEVYFWKFEWRANLSRLSVLAGGKNGRQIENLSAPYSGPYSPNPHIVRLGSVGGRAGSDTNPGTIIRNVWVSANPRPAFSGER
jgi:hypothetical protein